jgi:hypothetical protein
VGVGRSPNVRVRRVASGRWEALPVFSASLTRASLQHRIVSEQEALSGIGTYVGCCVCVARVSDHSARALAYGVVVGYEWKADASSSILYVDFGDKTDTVLFDGSALQDLAIVTFALRSCSGRPVADVMPGGMREINKVAYEAFMRTREAHRKRSKWNLKCGSAPEIWRNATRCGSNTKRLPGLRKVRIL